MSSADQSTVRRRGCRPSLCLRFNFAIVEILSFASRGAAAATYW
jgi:hypothetical protein